MHTSGTYHGKKTVDNKKYRRLSIANKTTVEEGKIESRQVICNSKIPMEIMKETGCWKVPTANPKLKVKY